MKRIALPVVLLAALLSLGAKPPAKPSADEKKPKMGEDTFAGLKLRGIGPAMISGRITDLAVDPTDGSPELTFGENGRLTGSTGCNPLNAPYTRRDAAVVLGPVGATRGACAEPTKRDLETRFGAMLRDVDGFRLRRTQLVLMHGSKPLSRFVAAE